MLFLFSFVSLRAQLDLEHWFPPFYRTGGGISELYFYLSTDKETPFKVKVFNNGTLLNTFTISKSSPVSFTLDDSNMMYAMAPRQTMQPTKMGIHITGEQSFYASLRIASGPEMTSKVAEVIASKGKSALGKEFYVVTDQNILYGMPNKDMNNMVSIMATRDNTHIKVNNFNKKIVFTDDKSYDELNYILNRDESLIVAMLKSNNPEPSVILDDDDPNFIGAKIVSDQPIVVTNGNFLSQDVGGEVGADINMDQSLPVTKIGKEYFIVNGMTKTETAMEKPLFVAIKDNTKIYYNDDTKPVVTLNAGQHYIGFLPSDTAHFIKGGQQDFKNSDSITVPTKGLYIHGTQPFYTYQLIGGFNMMIRGPVPDQTYGSSGMAFSYPIDKNYMPDSRQNLSNTIQIPSVQKLGRAIADNKITIKTQDGAIVSFNDSQLPASSFTPIPGKSGWSYFTIPYRQGDINITSDKSLNIDVVGGFRYAGFGSSYTGFSNDPFIIQNGNCVEEGVYLYLNNKDFISFQWQLNGVNIPGATNSDYQPIAPGSYTCVCYYLGFSFTTTPVAIEQCPYAITEKNLGNFCHSFSIEPMFSPPKTKDEVLSVEILTQPLHGSASLADTTINVVVDEDFSGNNRIVYKLNGKNGYYEIVKGNFYIYASPTAELKNSIFPINIRNTNFVYNLTDSVINNTDNDVIKYYPTQQDAEKNSNEITGLQITTYVTKSEAVFARITNQHNCYVIREIDLIQIEDPDSPPTGTDSALPNFFSPNGDGVNDVWEYTLLDNPKDLMLAIYDRYGIRVYEHKQNKNFWDGKNESGTICPSGTYWVYYAFTDSNGKKIEKSLWILLKAK